MLLLSVYSSITGFCLIKAAVLLQPMKNTGRQAVEESVIKEEARLLSEIWDSKSKVERGSQATFGESYGIGNQSAVGQFLRGEVPLSLKAARGFAKGLQCKISAFSPRLSTAVDEASAVNQPESLPKQWPFLTVTPDQYWNVLTQTQRDILEATAHSFTGPGARESPSKHSTPEITTNTKAA